MALQMFADAIDQGKPVKLYNGGNMKRDFTFVSDIVDGVVRVLGEC
jgi:UDP-glucuronate 4-epimerase